MAPKISRRLPDGTHTVDEPYAWEAREYLRKKLVGKDVSYRVEYSVPFAGAQRECVLVYLGNECINDALVGQGLVEVQRRAQNKDNPEVLRLSELEAAAKSSGVGRWSGGKPIKRTLLQEVENPAPLLGKTFDAIVEHVRDGSTLRIGVFLPDSTENELHMQMTLFLLSGVRTPQTSEPFGESARFFTESRLLQRDVKVRLEQMNNNNFVGTLIYQDRDLAEYLIREGYAKILDWTLGLTKEPKKLRELEKVAKANKLRIWKDYKETVSTTPAPVLTSGGGRTTARDFEAKVVEIGGADNVYVQLPDTKEVKKIFIASVRPPRLGEAEGAGAVNTGAPGEKRQFRQLYDVPYMFEAREFLRKKLIDKTVKVHVDYVQPSKDSLPEKVCCTILVGQNGPDKMNVGEALVAKGLCTVVKYRADDDQRASDYDNFLAAELRAQKNQKGIYSGKADAGLVRIVDLSVDQTKSKSFAPFLTRSTGTRREAVVEYVYGSSTRVKVYIPKENCLINLVLSGVNSPKQNDPAALAAVSWARLRVMHRDVQIEIETTDKVGNYIGSLYYNKSQNLALELVRAGLLAVRDNCRNSEFFKLEADAKAARKGIWKDWQEEVATANEEPGYYGADDDDEEDAVVEDKSVTGMLKEMSITNPPLGAEYDGKVDYDMYNGNNRPVVPIVKKVSATLDDLDKRKKVVVTNVSAEFTSFHAQAVTDGPKLEEMMVRLRQEVAANPPALGTYQPKKGDVVMARFSEDKLWYRARVDKLEKGGAEAQVVYIDYGNRETLPVKEIAALPLGSYGTTTLPAVAKEYAFAFVFADKDPEFVEELRNAFLDLTSEKVLLLKAEYRDASGLDAATLVDGEAKKDVVLKLVEDGWLFVDVKTRRERRLLKKAAEYKDAMEKAKKNGVSVVIVSMFSRHLTYLFVFVSIAAQPVAVRRRQSR